MNLPIEDQGNKQLNLYRKTKKILTNCIAMVTIRNDTSAYLALVAFVAHAMKSLESI